MNEKAMAALARAIGHPLRIKVLALLMDEPALVQELVDQLEVEPTSLSKQLAVLREAGLVQCEAEWRCRRYRLVAPAEVKALLRALESARTEIGS